MTVPPEHLALVRDAATGVATVVLRREGKHNALTRQMCADLIAVFDDLATDADIRAVVLRGEGPSFCAGQDIKEPPPQPASARTLAEGNLRRNVAAAISRYPLPVVAALHGNVIGRGVDIALACDFRIAASDTRMALPEVRMGMALGGGAIERLVRRVGESRAMRMLTLGEPVDAVTAEAWGLVDQVVDRGALETESAGLATRLAALPELAVAGTKLAVRRLGDAWSDVAARSDALANVLRRRAQHGDDRPRVVEERS